MTSDVPPDDAIRARLPRLMQETFAILDERDRTGEQGPLPAIPRNRRDEAGDTRTVVIPARLGSVFAAALEQAPDPPAIPERATDAVSQSE